MTIQKPVILLLDEPGSNLDFTSKYELRSLINNLYKRTGITVLMVSHEIDLLPSSCKRVVLMHQGKIVNDGPTNEVLTEGVLAKAYQHSLKVVDIDGYKYIADSDRNES